MNAVDKRQPEPETTLSPLLASLSRLEPKAIAVYGLGVVAQSIVDRLANLPVVGLLDKDPANRGRILFGQRVLSDEELAVRGVDTIVIAASDVYWRTIAERITPLCRRQGIQVVFPNGEPAIDDGDDCCVTAIDTDLGSLLEQQIASHDVISFDLFETLVTRLASRPDELLELATARTLDEITTDLDLLALRRAAEEQCRQELGAFRFQLGDVYRRMRETFGVPAQTADVMLRHELAVEAALTVPRNGMVDWVRRCVATGKAVTVTTDTHLPEDTLGVILQNCGFSPDLPLLISWRENAAKTDGSLFQVLRNRHPGLRILHIGDNAESDIAVCRRQGLDALHLPAPAQCLMSSRWRKLFSLARTTDDGLLIGLVARRLFADPFAARLDRGRITVGDPRDFGYLFFGPLLLAWLGWLAQNLRRRPTDTLWFLAREGYFLTPLYNRIRSDCGWDDLPEGRYFATSRRMASVAALACETDVFALLDDPFSGSSEQLLRLRYGLVENDAPTTDALTHTDERARAVVRRHLPNILANAAEERAAYLGYIAGLGITADDRVALADLGIKGSIQHALQRLLGRSLDGHYITGFFAAANPFGMCENTFALFPEGEGKEPSQVYRYHILAESVLVAPEGMYLRIGSDGRFQNAPARMNQTLFAQKEALHQGVGEFVSDWLSTGVDPARARWSPELVDALFGLAMSPDTRLMDELKASFYVDEQFRAESEKRIWD